MKKKSPAADALKELIAGMKKIELDKIIGFKDKSKILEIEEVNSKEDEDEDEEEDVLYE